ncbi:MAG: hypothetical protein LBR74_06630, partial [Eubacterium sp.]|nr:hypothetical protein [Eubacterium sp.]
CSIYLANNKDTFDYTNQKASEIFADCCKRFGIPVGEIADTVYKIPELTKPNTTAWDVIANALTLTYEAYGIRYYPIAKDGKLSLIERRQNILQWVIESKHNLLDYSYNNSIEKIKTRVKILSKEGKVLAEKSNEELKKKIGIFQDVVSKTDEMNDGQLSEIAANMLAENSKSTQTLSVGALGQPEVITGIGVKIIIAPLEISKTYYVEEDTHTFDGCFHSMKLKLSTAGDLSIKKPGSKIPNVGDVVDFLGGDHFISSSDDTPNNPLSGPPYAGKALVTYIALGNKHPYHLVGGMYENVEGNCNVYGWVNADRVSFGNAQQDNGGSDSAVSSNNTGSSKNSSNSYYANGNSGASSGGSSDVAMSGGGLGGGGVIYKEYISRLDSPIVTKPHLSFLANLNVGSLPIETINPLIENDPINLNEDTLTWLDNQYLYSNSCLKALIQKYREKIDSYNDYKNNPYYNMIENIRAEFVLFNPTSRYANYRFTGAPTIDKNWSIDKSESELKQHKNFAVRVLRLALALIQEERPSLNNDYSVDNIVMWKYLDNLGIMGLYDTKINVGHLMVASDKAKKAIKDGAHELKPNKVSKGFLEYYPIGKWFKFTPKGEGKSKHQFDLFDIPNKFDYDILLYNPNFNIIGAAIEDNKTSNSETFVCDNLLDEFYLLSNSMTESGAPIEYDHTCYLKVFGFDKVSPRKEEFSVRFADVFISATYAVPNYIKNAIQISKLWEKHKLLSLDLAPTQENRLYDEYSTFIDGNVYSSYKIEYLNKEEAKKAYENYNLDCIISEAVWKILDTAVDIVGEVAESLIVYTGKSGDPDMIKIISDLYGVLRDFDIISDDGAMERLAAFMTVYQKAPNAMTPICSGAELHLLQNDGTWWYTMHFNRLS